MVSFINGISLQGSAFLIRGIGLNSAAQHDAVFRGTDRERAGNIGHVYSCLPSYIHGTLMSCPFNLFDTLNHTWTGTMELIIGTDVGSCERATQFQRRVDI